MATSLSSKWACLASIVVLLLANFLFFAVRRSRQEAEPTSSLRRLPLMINGWEGREFPIPEKKLEMLGTSNVILRQYRKGAWVVELYIAESATNRSAFHPPEYCYVGGRTELITRGLTELFWGGSRVAANRMVFQGPRGKSLVYYWYTFGGRSVASYYRQQVSLIISNLLGKSQSAFLVRLSVEEDSSPGGGEAAIRGFAREGLPSDLGSI